LDHLLPSLLAASIEKGSPRTFRLSKAVVTNHDMPAHLPGDNLDKFIKKMVGDGKATQENNCFLFPMDEGARAKESIDNPIAYVQEFMAVVHSSLSVVVGIVPENFFSQMSGKTTRKTVYLVNRKGAIGQMWAYHVVVEANNRGDLHFHLLCFGSLPPHVLTNFATCPVICKKIGEVLESYYTTELDREFIVYKAMQNVLSERKMRRLPVFTLDKHICFTCSKGITGNTGCRYNRLLPVTKKINLVRLSARRKLPGTDEYYPGDGGKGDEPWIVVNVEDSSVWESKYVLDPSDRTVFYWDLTRPPTEPMDAPFPHYADYMNDSLIFLQQEKQEKARMVGKKLCCGFILY
jgi:hypothetical protein